MNRGELLINGFNKFLRVSTIEELAAEILINRPDDKNEFFL